MTDLALDPFANADGREIALGCSDCGEISLIPRHPGGGAVFLCPRCDAALERTGGRSLEAGLALSCAALVLMVPGLVLPLMTTSALGAARTSALTGLPGVMWRDGRPWLGLAMLLFLVVFPLLRLGLVTTVLARLHRRGRPAWLGPAFRLAEALKPWAMTDVFLVALLIAYSRLAATISVSLRPGAFALAGAGVLMLAARAALDPAQVWESIASAPEPRPGPALACHVCGRVEPGARSGAPCPRCGAHLRRRKTGAVRRAAALTLAGAALYIPANLYPIATLPVGLTPTRYTILEGVRDLAAAGLGGLALVVFTASFAIPCIKLVGMAWCATSVVAGSRRALKVKSRLFSVIDEIGRWSMIDPFVIGAFVPVMQYNDYIFGRAEPAAAAFTAVVVLTMLAARAFDPRLMWDAAVSPRGGEA